jgi:hypothetical protein
MCGGSAAHMRQDALQLLNTRHPPARSYLWDVFPRRAEGMGRSRVVRTGVQ